MLTDEQIIALADEAHDKWNSEADRDNQWDSLGHDEIFVLIARAIESAVRAEYADVPHEEWNGEGWESLAWHLCAEENGEDACNDLLWVGGAVPEPWGDRWQRYEGDAKRMIRLVKEHYNPKIGGEE